MDTFPNGSRTTALHLPTALQCLVLQCLFIAMCLYQTVTRHDFQDLLSTVSFSSIYLATQALIWAFASVGSVHPDGASRLQWEDVRLPATFLLLSAVGVAALVEAPALASRFLALGNPVALSADGTDLHLSGSIPINLSADIEAVCSNGACIDVRKIILTSAGGSFEGAIEGLDTLKRVGVRQATVDDYCEGACVAIWAGFDDATVPSGSVIGIQGIYDPGTGKPTAHSQRDTQQLDTLLLARGFPRDLVDRATAYPSGRFYYLSGSEIRSLLNPQR